MSAPAARVAAKAAGLFGSQGPAFWPVVSAPVADDSVAARTVGLPLARVAAIVDGSSGVDVPFVSRSERPALAPPTDALPPAGRVAAQADGSFGAVSVPVWGREGVKTSASEPVSVEPPLARTRAKADGSFGVQVAPATREEF